MESETDQNLSRFLSAYQREGRYLLIPAILRDAKAPNFLMDLGILKRELSIGMGKDLHPDDLKSALLRHPSPSIDSADSASDGPGR